MDTGMCQRNLLFRCGLVWSHLWLAQTACIKALYYSVLGVCTAEIVVINKYQILSHSMNKKRLYVFTQ